MHSSSFLNMESMKLILVGMIFLVLVLCLVIVILVIRNSSLRRSIDESILKISSREQSKDEQAPAAVSKDGWTLTDPPVSRNVGYFPGEETGEIILEHAADNNRSKNVPPIEEKKQDRIEDAMRSRPFGIDSAFEVVSPDDEKVKQKLSESEQLRQPEGEERDSDICPVSEMTGDEKPDTEDAKNPDTAEQLQSEPEGKNGKNSVSEAKTTVTAPKSAGQRNAKILLPPDPEEEE